MAICTNLKKYSQRGGGRLDGEEVDLVKSGFFHWREVRAQGAPLLWQRAAGRVSAPFLIGTVNPLQLASASRALRHAARKSEPRLPRSPRANGL